MADSFITPKYIYKILPPNAPPPSPLPLALPVSALDARDNFIHMSTSRQVIGTLRNFFKGEDYVWMLRIPYARVEKWIKWENSVGKGPEEPVGDMSFLLLFFLIMCRNPSMESYLWRISFMNYIKISQNLINYRADAGIPRDQWGSSLISTTALKWVSKRSNQSGNGRGEMGNGDQKAGHLMRIHPESKSFIRIGRKAREGA
jgi:uncharacterized protein (DUF952 family)